MRVVIVDSDLKAGRRLAASVEEMVPTADVLLYPDAEQALAGISTHEPDVAFVATAIGDVKGPRFVAEARAANDAPKYVGVVDTPSPDASIAWISAGAKLVVQRPVDRLGIRTALRHTAGGIDT
jgi:DNA-binding response OmpR family regulator